MQTERSLAELTRDLASQAGELMRHEVRLARAEAVESVKGMAGSAVRVALGVALAGAALTLALFALAYAFGEALPMWAGALISAGLGGVAAYELIRRGLKGLSAEGIQLPRTQAQVARDLRRISEELKS